MDKTKYLQAGISLLRFVITVGAADKSSRVYLHTHRCSSRHRQAHALPSTHSNTSAGCQQRRWCRRPVASRKTHPRATCEGWLYRGRPWRQSVIRSPPPQPPATLSGRFTTAHVVCSCSIRRNTTTYRGHFVFRWLYARAETIHFSFGYIFFLVFCPLSPARAHTHTHNRHAHTHTHVLTTGALW